MGLSLLSAKAYREGRIASAKMEPTADYEYISMSERVEPNTLDDVAAVMKASLPDGMTPKLFGQVMQWGRGHASARRRMATLTLEELRNAGITVEMANNWAAAYDAVVRLAPTNPSAAGRADLMRYAAQLLSGSK